MSNKRRVYVSIHHRDEFSLGDNRARLGHGAFHWGILVTPKKPRGGDCLAFDVSNGVVADPVSMQDTNRERDWMFRAKTQVDPARSGRLIGRVLIGKVPNNVTDGEIQAVLAAVPLPVKGGAAAVPRESCVTWTVAAIAALQDAGLARKFDVARFIVWALSYADFGLASPNAHNAYDYDYTY